MKHRLGDAPARMMKHRLGDAPARMMKHRLGERLPRAVGIFVLSLAVTASGPGTALGQEGPHPSEARNVRVCDAGDAACASGVRMTQVGNDLEVEAFVTDAEGRPVAEVPVELREEGVAAFAPGGDRVVVTTGADGRAGATLVAASGGGSEVSAEISPVGTPGGFRGPATHDDECERPSDPDGTPAAGNCVSAPLSVHWEEELPFDGECADRVDNDGDGSTDLEDTDCASGDDPSEGHGDPIEAHWARAVRLRLSEWTKGSRRRLVVFGRVTLPDGGPRQCVGDMPVDVARRVDGGWVHLGRVITNEDGWYVAVLRDRSGRYRATAPRRRAHLENGEAPVCRRAIRVHEHRHAR